MHLAISILKSNYETAISVTKGWRLWAKDEPDQVTKAKYWKHASNNLVIAKELKAAIKKLESNTTAII